MFNIVVVFNVAEFDIMVIDVSAFVIAVFDILHMTFTSGTVLLVGWISILLLLHHRYSRIQLQW